MILVRIGVFAQLDADAVVGTNIGWFFNDASASGHLLTCGLI
jgi:hypothetical protein